MSTAYRIDMIKVIAKIKKAALCFAAVLLFWAAVVWFGLGISVGDLANAINGRETSVTCEVEESVQNIEKSLESVEVLAAGLE